ncbi:helix-turn-helix domain protein [Granulicella sibirica]|uniref:Helix-turn-helix domain protein n=1 Tax=Granulicella sibirica TaxID=2479048 RepID=A0A4Q0T6U4_9BACT|nr:helix-turn-helix domain protein [Granulicella sibirica]
MQEKLNVLPKERREKIEKRAALLIAEEMTMRELRKARKITQAEMAKTLGVKQEQVSRIEKRTDLHLSTLRRSVEAMGGRLSLVVEFPNGAPVVVSGLTNSKI